MFVLTTINKVLEELGSSLNTIFAIDREAAFNAIKREGYTKISFCQINDVLVIDVKGKDFPPKDAVRFNHEVASLAYNQNYKDYKKVVLNFKEADYMNAAGLGTLVSLNKRLQNNGGTLKICCLPDQLTKLMKILKLDTVLNIHDSESQALESLQAI
ncbi:MAG: hypothetical protein A3I68_03660 [Candidatus Melainabacteria bacterium RIFCSPLOWO2_02_FULL_35_15]|nr:MAG: hypothetical protein A3F80_03975 [Candidatus Melainabacteria bacterium RIFCSPLOWO2_12_FULL_35_11]OGI14697.1 MAG: hypothetical protein A3I68_03660 [Candidatus Melainabacteria bacterium RIFCSPLOWO2_02_FULL_35_15]